MKKHLKKRWSKEEKEFLIKEYKKLGRQGIAKKLGRTLSAVDMQHYKLRHHKKDEETTDYEARECPKCGSKNFNAVSSVVAVHKGLRCMEVYYCMNCLHEFTKNGEIIQPLWEGMEAR